MEVSGFESGFRRGGVPCQFSESNTAMIIKLTNARAANWLLIADQLNDDQVPTKQGGTWRAQTVKNILEAVHAA